MVRPSIASLVAATILVRFALNFVAADVWVSRITAIFGWARAERLVTDRLALSLLGAKGKFAWILAHLPPGEWVWCTGEIFRAASVT